MFKFRHTRREPDRCETEERCITLWPRTSRLPVKTTTHMYRGRLMRQVTVWIVTARLTTKNKLIATLAAAMLGMY